MASDIKQTSSKKVTPEYEASIIKQVSFVGIFGNVVLTAFKLFAGVVGNSAAMVSDAIHSASDIFATLIAFIGVTLSKKGEDDSHNYGHEKLECIAALILGCILVAVGFGIGKTGVENIITGAYKNLELPSTIALIAAIVSIVVKEAMFWYTRHYALILNSTAFMADAWHHRSDAFSSIGSMAGIAGAMLGFPILDSIACVVICVFILKVGFDVLKDSFKKLLDASCGNEYRDKVIKVIREDEEVKTIDLVNTRLFGSKVFIDVEISVDRNKTLVEAHDIAESIHDRVEGAFPEVKHVMVHVNPAEN